MLVQQNSRKKIFLKIWLLYINYQKNKKYTFAFKSVNIILN